MDRTKNKSNFKILLVKAKLNNEEIKVQRKRKNKTKNEEKQKKRCFRHYGNEQIKWIERKRLNFKMLLVKAKLNNEKIEIQIRIINK